MPYGVTLNPFMSPIGLPCKQPAWGYVSALDLTTNQIVWKKRIGTTRDASPIPIPFKMGMPILGGPMTTAGRVFFIGATTDDYIRAFSTDTGKQLWQARLPAGGQATPMTYEANGKQYVVIAAGGHGSFLTKMGDYVVAYTLPSKQRHQSNNIARHVVENAFGAVSEGVFLCTAVRHGKCFCMSRVFVTSTRSRLNPKRNQES